MNAVLELTLSHDGHHWITDAMDRQLRGKDLRQLEHNITNVIKIDPLFIDNETIDVTLLFDMDHFPRRLHQYQSHYFNYSFTVDKRKPD